MELATVSSILSLLTDSALVTQQMQEMEMVRSKVYSLEQTQLAIKQR